MCGTENETEERGMGFWRRKTLMRSRQLWPSIALAGILYAVAAQFAAAIPTSTPLDRMMVSGSHGLTQTTYYYHGRPYPYRYHGMYYRHRYYRNGRWHYY